MDGRYRLTEKIQNYIRSLNATSVNKIKMCKFNELDKEEDLQNFISDLAVNISSIDPIVFEFREKVNLFDSKNIYNMY